VGFRLLDPVRHDFYGWTIEFHIIDAPRLDGNFEIPFFSRLLFAMKPGRWVEWNLE
jgi:hypothetical protein